MKSASIQDSGAVAPEVITAECWFRATGSSNGLSNNCGSPGTAAIQRISVGQRIGGQGRGRTADLPIFSSKFTRKE